MHEKTPQKILFDNFQHLQKKDSFCSFLFAGEIFGFCESLKICNCLAGVQRELQLADLRRKVSSTSENKVAS
jgi:hypothetical protein